MIDTIISAFAGATVGSILAIVILHFGPSFWRWLLYFGWKK